MSGPDYFYKPSKEDLIPILLKLCQKIKTEEILPNLFYEDMATCINHTKTQPREKNSDPNEH